MRGKNRKVDRSRRGLAVVAIGALTLTGIGFVPNASAVPGPAGIAAGKNITVFHNVDFIATFGWAVGESVTVQVLRNGAVIGQATGPAVDTPEGGALEVNHGPEGAPQPGDCWEGHTPDVRPGDLVRVTGGGTTNEVIVDEISLSAASHNLATNEVEVRGIARTAAGVAIPPADLNSGEFRTLLPGGQYRATPSEPVADPTRPGVVGAFVMHYPAPYTGFRQPANSTEEQRRNALLTDDGHAAGFGHVAPLPDEAQLAEGYGDSPGPALGCEASATANDNLNVTPSRINLSNAGSGVTVSGATTSGSVMVTLDDNDGSAADALELEIPTPDGTYSETFAGPLTGLEGVLTAVATHDGGPSGGAANTRTLLRDVTAPGAPSVSPSGGPIDGPRSVFLSGGLGDTIRYTVGNGTQAAPTPSTGSVFSGPFNVTAGQTVKAIAVDGADNPSAVTTAAFTQAAAPPPVVTPPSSGGSAVLPLAPGIAKAKSGKRGGVKTATARWRAPSANGAVVNGYRVRAFKIRPGKSAKKVKVVRIGASKTRVKMVLPRGTYRFQVRASSTAGKSSWSARSNKVRSR